MPIEKPSYIINQVQAKKQIELTDHLLYVTYNLVKEVKFVVSISEHILKALQLSLQALLEFERDYKRIEVFPSTTFLFLVDTYHNKVEKRYNFDPKFYRLFKRLIELQRYIKDSNMRFRRQDKYILATETYETKVLDIETVKKYHTIAREFVDLVGGIVSKR